MDCPCDYGICDECAKYDKEDKTMPKTITITEEDFDNAIVQVMDNSMEDPTLKKSAGAMILYTLGGVAFAKHVKDELFHDDCEETDG